VKHLKISFLTLVLIALSLTSIHAATDTSKYGELTIPSYGNDKVKAMIKQIKSGYSQALDTETSILSTENYNSLTVKEKFTYTMMHGEIVTSEIIIHEGYESLGRGKISKDLNFTFPKQFIWSKRQIKFMQENREKCLELIQEILAENKFIGDNIKAAIILLNAHETIPSLIDHLKNKPVDNNITTTLIQLMYNNKFSPLFETTTYKALALEENSEVIFPSILSTMEYQQEIINTAQKYYQSKQKP
jgi:hypothetical protein